MKGVKSVILVAIASGLWSTVPAAAQPLGSFRWQLAPYCNIVTLAVVQQGGQYQLDGTDDQCGAPQAASVRGMAFQNPNGLIGFGLTVVTAPGGTPVHIDAVISVSGLNGTWQDSAGNTGNFIFGAGVPSAGPRPVPTGGLAPQSVTTIQIAPAAVTNAQLAANAVSGANVIDGSLTTADILGAPRAVFADGNQSITLTATPAVMRTVTLTAPTAGIVVVNASGYFKLQSTANDAPRCSIVTGTTVDFNSLIIADDGGSVASTAFVPFAATRGFSVSAGAFTVNLVCELATGAVDVRDTLLTATFIGG